MRINGGNMAMRTLLALLFALAVCPLDAWPHGGAAHSGPMQRGDPAEEKRGAEIRRREQIDVLQEKIDKLDEKLENPALSAKKRAKLEKKLKKLLDEKNRLLAEREQAPQGER